MNFKTFYSTIIAIGLFCISFGTLSAQNDGVFTGTVVDQEGGIPLPGARISIQKLKTGTYTNNRGEFTLLNLPVGEYEYQITYIGYQTEVGMLNIAPGKTVSKVIRLVEADVTSDEVVVIGDALRGQARALNQQKSTINTTNIVSSDQMGRFPDANVGDAMKRIPGITVQYDQGEARFGLVRGTASRLNSVMINGDRIPSAEAENRSIQLDLIPADMIQTIEVNKAITPDMDADAIGGAINLVTRGAPYNQRISVTAASGLNLLTEQPIWTGALVYGNRVLDDKLGVILSASYNNHTLGSDNIEAEWNVDDDGNVFMEDFQIRDYELQRVRRSLSLGFDYEFDPNNKVYVNGMYNWRDDWENRYRARYIFDDAPGSDGIAEVAEIRRQTKGGIDNDRVDNARLEDQRTYNFGFNGEHLLFNKVQLTWQGNYAQASEDRPNERYIEWENEEIPVGVNISNQRKPNVAEQVSQRDPSTFALREITEENQNTTDTDFNFRLDVEIPLLEDEYKNSIKVGGRFRSKAKDRNNNFFEYTPVNEYGSMAELGVIDKTVEDYLAGNYRSGLFTDPNALGALDLENSGLFEKTDVIEEYAAANFEATEVITGGYVMLKQDLGPLWNIIAGVRLENTVNEYNGSQYIEDDDSVRDTSSTSDYMNIMPSILVRWQAQENLVVKASVTNTLARPNYYDLVPYQIINLEDNEIAVGNPALEPTTAVNFDLIGEIYFEQVGLVTGGGFFKLLDNYIFTQQRRNIEIGSRTYDVVSRPENGDAANIYGFEVAFQRKFDFLPGFLKDFGLFFNYTNTQSEIVDGLPNSEGRAEENAELGFSDDDIQLAGTANHMLNASLFFENEKLSTRLSLNYTSEYVDEYGSSAFFDRYYGEQMFLDFNASYRFLPTMRAFIEANNLTNQPLYYFQGVASRMMQAEYYNARFNVGVKFDM
ncbi:MAG: TonB-dependent receptor [Candidatus Kapaibacteriales bacterium]